MKKIIPFLSLVLLSFLANAQDFIYLRDGTNIKSIVKKISDKEVFFRDFDSNDTTLFSVKKPQVLMIAFENGEVKFFKKEQEIIHRFSFKKNLISYHLADLIINDFTLSYEHIFKNGTLGLQIPVSLGYSEYFDYSDFTNNFYSGVYINFYPTGQGKWRYFFGPGIRLGSGRYSDNWYDTQTQQYYTEHHNTFYGKLLVNNGVMFTPITSFSLSATVSLGIRYAPGIKYHNDNYRSQQVRTSGAFSFNMSYRF
jgi:hypothetical protein